MRRKLFVKHFFLNPIFSAPGERKVWFGPLFQGWAHSCQATTKSSTETPFFLFLLWSMGCWEHVCIVSRKRHYNFFFYVNFSVWKTLISGYFPATATWVTKLTLTPLSDGLSTRLNHFCEAHTLWNYKQYQTNKNREMLSLSSILWCINFRQLQFWIRTKNLPWNIINLTEN